MRLFVRRLAAPVTLGTLASFVAVALAPTLAHTQAPTGTIAGRVTDSAGSPLAAAVRVIGGSRYGANAGADGGYVIANLPAGQYQLETRSLGFRTDTFAVAVSSGETIHHHVVLQPISATLKAVVVASPRLNETKAGALEAQRTADNIISVLSGDDIRSLPNANAAEAAARMPGVTSERDEGEGKFVEIRGTPPTFQNVEIDGVHIPGTLSGDRSVKLDDIPSDLLGAIEVSKTLTAEMDANAIGGTVNLVSKIPEGAPRGYIAGQYAHQGLENNSQGQGSVTYGGRIGDGSKLGFLIGGSYDRTNRVIEDVEPFYQADFVAPNGAVAFVPNGSAYNHIYPNSWSEREYNYYRTRYGFDGDIDYRFSPTSSVYLRGLWSAFFDQANRWVTSVNGTNFDVLQNGKFVDSGANVSTTVSNRGPIEHTWGLTGGGKHAFGSMQFDFQATYSGSSATTHQHFDDKYAGTGPLSDFAYTYGTSKIVPRFYPTNSAVMSAIGTASNYALSGVNVGNEGIDGQNVGGALNALLPYSIGNLPAALKVGIKYYNEHKSDDPNGYSYAYAGANTLANYDGAYNVNNFYSHICAGCYPLAPFGSIPKVQSSLHGNPAFQINPGALFGNLLNTWSGTEQVSAVYGMQTVDISDLHINAGLRAEHTQIGYIAWNTDLAGDTSVASLLRTRQGHSYTDLFPSVQLRYGIGDNTNVRAAFTRGIARPNYSNLIPSFSFAGAIRQSYSAGLSAGNPSLKPEHAWNYDLLVEHYLPSVGVISGGVFYKDISNFIFNRRQAYTGQFERVAQYLPNDSGSFYIVQPQNGPHAWLYGLEADYTQHLTFLPGALRALGFDVNYTLVKSRATVPIPDFDSTSYVDVNGNTVFPYKNTPFRHTLIPRQFPSLFNASLLYDYPSVSARLTGQYTSASIYGYGTDGTSNPNSGDTWNFSHWQVDGSLIWTVHGSTALQAQVLNLTNAVFGFFNGLSGQGQSYNIQREYYGTTWYIGLRQGL